MNSIDTLDSQTAEALSQHNNFNVVYCVLLVIFIGILLYLLRLERKIARLEKPQS
ncbi:MAG: CcmD family protein [Flavobacteriaceae bacterium]|nr:CcmD family protein [Flavobacteriaceae bacterium]